MATIEELKVIREHTVEELKSLSFIDWFNRDCLMKGLSAVDREIARLESLQSAQKGGE